LSEPTSPPLIDPAQVRITPLGYVDHSDYGGKGVKLIYAERPDGSLVRVDHLETSPPTLICPVCRTHVHKVTSKKARLFFRHTSGAPGCGGPETNAHIWAKNELLKAKKLWLAPVPSAFPGVKQDVRKGQWFKFIDVEVEARRGDLIPDLVIKVIDAEGVTHELWVEIHVTHRCGPGKIAKIKARKQAAIEIDLSAYRTSFDAPAIREALLEGAMRTWLYHRAIDADFEARTKQVEAIRQAKAAETRREAEALVAAFRKPPRRWPSDAVRDIVGRARALGLDDVIGFSTPKAPFAVDNKVWQAAIWLNLVVEPMEEGQHLPPLRPFAALDMLQDFLPRAFWGFVPTDVIKVAREIEPKFVTPQEAILDYFRTLTQTRDLWASEFPDWHVTYQRDADLQERIYDLRLAEERTDDVEKRVAALLNKLPVTITFDLAAWFARRNLRDLTPSELIAGGAETWPRLDGALGKIEMMVAGGRVTEDLLGLPLEPLLAAAQERVRLEEEAAQRRKAEAEAKAAQDRIETLEAEAAHEIRGEAGAWLDTAGPDGVSFRDLARQSQQGLDSARRALWTRANELAAEAKRARRWSLNLEKLSRQALKIYGDLKGPLWMNGGHPKLGGVAPKEAAKDETGLQAALALLPRKPERQGH